MSIPATSELHPEKYVDVLRDRLFRAYAKVRKFSGLQQQHQKEVYDRKKRSHPYVVGDCVFLRDPVVPRGFSRKFHRPWKDPFKIVKVLGPTVYRIHECECP